MIPISSKQILSYKDPDSGITYRFKPLLGEAEYAYHYAMEAASNRIDHKPYLADAETAIKAANEGKAWGAGEFDIAVRDKAIEMAVRKIDSSPEKTRADMKPIDALINTVLVGWEAPEGLELPEFENPPAGCFKRDDRMELFSIIMKLNQGLTGAEEKN